MRSVPLEREPGEAEIASFADQTDRPLLVVGNGPSSMLPPLRRIPADPVIFRMNWFFLESHYNFGSHVDGWFFAIPHEELENRLYDEIRSRRYTVDRILSPMQLPSARDEDRWRSKLTELDVPQYDHWAPISRHPRLARFFMSRPGLPTSGMQALAFGLAVGFREIYLSGVDLYESKEARYSYNVPESVARTLTDKDLFAGYEPTAHSIDHDLAFLRACLAEFPDSKVFSISESVNLREYVEDAATLGDNNSLSSATKPNLGQPKDRVLFKSPSAGAAGPVLVKAPTDGRLWKEIDGRKCAYVTLVSGDYYHGARALANSLRAVSDVPLLAMCTADTNAAALAASGIHCIDVPEILNPSSHKSRQARFAATYTKLNAFRLDFLDRVVYLDSDAIVKRSPDGLFDGFGFSAASDAGLDRPNGEIFNSGVFAVEPSRELFEDMLSQLKKLPSYDGGDQGFLNSYFSDWHRLPIGTNTTKRIFAHHSAIYNADEVTVLHYVGAKPWQPAPQDGRYAELDRQWLEFLQPWEMRELILWLRDKASSDGIAEDILGTAGLGGSLFRKAQTLNRRGDFGSAAALLARQWKGEDASTAELRERARALRGLKRHKEALHFLQEAHRREPESRKIRREIRGARLRSTLQRVGLDRLF